MATYALVRAVRKGDLSEVRRLLEEEQVDPKRWVAGHEWTPLHWCCVYGYLSVVRYLVREVDEEKRCDPECVDDDGNTPLHVACAFGRLRVVTYLTETFPYRVNRTNKDGLTPLHLATTRGHVEVVKYLIENYEADPRCVPDNDGKTPVHLAIESLKSMAVQKTNIHLEIAEYLLLECKCSIMDDVEFSKSLLICACQEGRIDLVKYITETCQLDPNFMDENGNTPLSCVIESKQWETAKYLLLECQCKHSFKDGKDILVWACYHHKLHCIEVVQYLNNPKFYEDGSTPLHWAVQWGDLEEIKFIVESCKIDPNCPDRNGITPFVLVIDILSGKQPCLRKGYRYFEIAEYFILRYKYKITGLETVKPLLLWACENDRNSLVNYLTDTCKLESLLSCAVKKYEWKVAKCILLKFQFKPSRKDSMQMLLLAIRNNCIEAVQYLNDSGFYEDGSTPLHWAVQWGVLKKIKFVIENCKIDPNCADRNGITPFHLAIERIPSNQPCLQRHLEIAEYFLLEYRCNITDLEAAKPLLFWACKYHKTSLVKYLADDCKLKDQIHNCMNQNKRTLLSFAIEKNNWETAKHLLLECQCKPLLQDGKNLLQWAYDNNCIAIVQYLNDPSFYEDGSTPLHWAVEWGDLRLANYLAEVCDFDSNCMDSLIKSIECLYVEKWAMNSVNTDQIVQLSCRMGWKDILKYFISHDHPNASMNIFFNIAAAKEKWEIVKFFLLELKYYCVLTVGNRMKVFKWACKEKCAGVLKVLSTQKPLLWAVKCSDMNDVKFMVEACSLNYNTKDAEGRTLLHLAAVWGQTETVEYFIKTLHFDPDCADSNGWTCLHFAVAGNKIQTLKYLTEKCHCNLNSKSNDGYTPLHLAFQYKTATRILIKAGASLTTKPPQAAVKVFIVGNPSTGKSSLAKTLQRETTGFSVTLSHITGPQLVQDVQPMTAGIALSHFSSKRYGRVILYDMAGQQEYYASHATLLQNAISSYAPLFIIVVNLCDSEYEIKQKILYWVSFLANQFNTAVTTKPHIIIVGSHKDIVKSKGKLMEKANIQLLQSDPLLNGFSFSKFIPMDCRKSNSPSLVKLAETMKESCNTLRKQLGVAYHLHHLYSFLMKHFGEVETVTFKVVLVVIKQESTTLVTSNKDELYCDLCELSDRGEIFFLVDHKDITKSWIILNHCLLISDISGALFAPEGFEQHCKLANATGVLAVSKLSKIFPHYKSDMLVQLLTLLEFCCEVKDKEALQLIDQESSTLTETDPTFSDQYLLFPALISADVSSDIWKAEAEFTHTCGWMLQCSDDRQLLTSQFLQVLLLRIAFSCALAANSPEIKGIPVLRRKCTVWKSGIYWSNSDGIEVFMEIRHPPQNKEVLVMLRCRSGQDVVECACLRSTIIQMVLKAKKKFCHNVPTKEFIIHPTVTQLTYHPSNHINDKYLFNIMDISGTVTEGKPCVVNATGKSTKMNEIVLFEPYSNLGSNILQQLFIDHSRAISDNLYTALPKEFTQKNNFSLTC